MDIPRPIYLSGRVLMDDGSVPPDFATIELVCNGNPRPQGYTDSKGRFSINLGQNQGMMADASVGAGSDVFSSSSSGMAGSDRFGMNAPGTRGYTERDLMGCDLRANLAGYRSDVVPLSGRRVMDNPEVGTIVLHRLGNVEGFTYSLTTANAPKEAKKAYEKGLGLAKKKKWQEAETHLAKSVELYPKYAIAWFELGQVREQLKKTDEAYASFKSAVEADPKFVNPYLEIANIEARQAKWAEVAQTTGTILKLNPYSFPAAYFYNSVANFNLHKFEDAEKSAREAKKLDTNNRIPKISHLLGVILAQKKDYNGALENMKFYLTAAPMANDADTVRKQVAEIEKFLGTNAVSQTTPKQDPPKN